MIYWLISALIAGGTLVAYLQHRSRRGVYRPLAERQPQAPAQQDVPLGLEAVDLDYVARTTRRNESLERATTNWMRKGSGLLGAAAETAISPLADDETYAARYHAAFQKNSSKD
tara:strand:+ start:1899 stop:2240 length:342 start_codon:yes stop_codon:yes gene_type:complete